MSKGTFSFNGVGTTYYGRRDFGPDGSFTMTQWFIIFYFPIFPLRSYRAISHGRGDGFAPFYYKQNYSLSQPMRPNLKQVLYTYAYALAGVGSAVALLANVSTRGGRLSPPVVIIGLVVLGFLFAVLPDLLRGRAMRRAGLRIVRRRRHH